MASTSMTDTHRAAPWQWSLAPATALRLEPANRPRWLLVSAGRVWLTRSGAGPHAADVWLAAGERHELPAGSDWVLEGWPSAQVELLEAPRRCPRPAPAARRWHGGGAAHAA